MLPERLRPRVSPDRRALRAPCYIQPHAFRHVFLCVLLDLAHTRRRDKRVAQRKTQRTQQTAGRHGGFFSPPIQVTPLIVSLKEPLP